MTWVSVTRKLGSSGPTVFPLALGCMGMSGIYGKSEDDESVATIHAALDQGVTLLDTGDFYGMGHNEILIGIVPVIGARKRTQLAESLGALRFELSEDESCALKGRFRQLRSQGLVMTNFK